MYTICSKSSFVIVIKSEMLHKELFVISIQVSLYLRYRGLCIEGNIPRKSGSLNDRKVRFKRSQGKANKSLFG